MKVSDLFAARSVRIALLGSATVGAGCMVVGAVIANRIMLVTGVALVGLINLVLAKAVLETVSTARGIRELQRSVETVDRTTRQAAADIEDLIARDLQLEAGLASELRSREVLHDEITSTNAVLDAQVHEFEEARSGIAALARAIDDLRAQTANLAGSHETTRMALKATRALTDRLADRSRNRLVDDRRLLAVASTEVESPVLSIAIPSFDRPAQLADLLASIAAEVEVCPDGLVEVCITDDASKDPEAIEIALAFAEQHRFASLQVQQHNVGIERNILAAGKPCRGEYLLLIGNDDILIPGALDTILHDVRSTSAPLLIYSKRRMNLDGSPHPDVTGSIPIELPPGEAHVFGSSVDAARERGLLSTFGFIGPIVKRRLPFLAVDPSPYLDLTMYAQVFVTMEAFAREAVFYRNVATILHRTPTPAQKHAEALSRPTEEFMSGGKARLARYFGTSLAAALQRLIDRGALDHATTASMPEHLMTKRPLAEWISHNRKLDPAVEERLDVSVVEDADRFFKSLETIPSLGHLR
jgi:hypothetical protein